MKTKRRIILFTLISMLLTLASASIQSYAASAKKPFYYKVSQKIHSSMPKYSFAVYGTAVDENYYYKSMKVSNPQTGKLLQTIMLPYMKADVNLNGMKSIFFEDMNFDGYLDFRMPDEYCAGNALCYFFYLYDVRTKKYKENIEMNNALTSPGFDAKNKKIVSSIYSSISGCTFTHRFIKGKLTQTYQYCYEEIENGYTARTSKIIDGKLTEYKHTEETSTGKETCQKESQLINGKWKQIKDKCVKKGQSGA